MFLSSFCSEVYKNRVEPFVQIHSLTLWTWHNQPVQEPVREGKGRQNLGGPRARVPQTEEPWGVSTGLCRHRSVAPLGCPWFGDHLSKRKFPNRPRRLIAMAAHPPVRAGVA